MQVNGVSFTCIFEGWEKGFTDEKRQESNLHLKFRKLLFYPLNYEGRFLKCVEKHAKFADLKSRKSKKNADASK